MEYTVLLRWTIEPATVENRDRTALLIKAQAPLLGPIHHHRVPSQDVMGISRPSGKRKGIRAFTTGSSASSLHGVGRHLVPRPMTASQISRLNASILEEIAKAPPPPSIQVSVPYQGLEDPTDDYDDQDLMDILDGDVQLGVSGAGGEFEHLRDDATTTAAQR